MSGPAPWKCPECAAWIAPHAAEHRCDPPDSAVPAGVTVLPGGPAAPAPFTSTTTADYPVTVCVNISGNREAGYRAAAPVQGVHVPDGPDGPDGPDRAGHLAA